MVLELLYFVAFVRDGPDGFDAPLDKKKLFLVSTCKHLTI